MAKQSNGTTIYFKIAGLLIVLVVAAVGHGVLSGNVEHNAKDIEKMQPTVDSLVTLTAILETRQTAIYDGVRRIELKLDKLRAN